MAAATKKKRKEEAYPWKAGASSGHITNLKQSILDFRYLCSHVTVTGIFTFKTSPMVTELKKKKK
jgi:hypothetical protein